MLKGMLQEENHEQKRFIERLNIGEECYDVRKKILILEDCFTRKTKGEECFTGKP